MRDAFLFEFELASHNLIAMPPGVNLKEWKFILVNQAIPFAYRSDFFIEVNKIYNEEEYEFNEVLILKKIASFFVTVATGQEPENQSELVRCVQNWHDKTMLDMPRNKELISLLNLAYRIVQSLNGDLMPLSTICNTLMHDYA